RLAPELRRGGARLGLRLARPRRRRLRAALPRAQPDRLRRPALDRMGGLGDGPRVRGAGRARVRAAHRLRAVVARLRRGDAAGDGMSETGFQTMGRAAGGGEIRTIGVGMLGYAFMGKAHSNGYRKLAHTAWPP